jgi:hypothetical protein
LSYKYTTHGKKMVLTRQDVENPEVVIDYNCRMGGMDLSEASLTSCRSTRKRLKKYCQKHSCCLNSYLLYKKKGQAFSGCSFK